MGSETLFGTDRRDLDPSRQYGDGTAQVLPTPLMEPAQQGRSKSTVLVLEDDLAQLQILLQHLESAGLQTVSASTIATARQRLQDTDIQLAVFDVHLPDGSGLELCGSIDDDPGLVGLPVVILSSATQSDIVRRTRAAGACYFIGKPYDPNVLLAIIEQALDEAR